MIPATQFKRKNIRLPADRYRGQAMYFVTLCFANRRRFGANPRVASWIIDSLRKHAAICGFYVHAYCVMPDHIHALAAGATEQSNLMKFVESFKQATAVDFARETHRQLWQFKYYDHILRASDTADSIAWYIWLNPVRQRLCGTPADYPFLGSFTNIGKRMLKSLVVLECNPPWKKANPAARPERNQNSTSAALKTAALRLSPKQHPKEARQCREQ